MKAALVGRYIEFATFQGMTERYPAWLAEELYRCTYLDESRFTMWVPREERKVDYYEKKLIEDRSVFLRKTNGDLFVTDLEVFDDLYTTFRYDAFTNSGVAAFKEDCMEYVECTGGVLIDEYPAWFYEYFTEAVNYPYVETIYFHDNVQRVGSKKQPFMELINGEVTVADRCVFLRNKLGEVRGMGYGDFLKHYDPFPQAEY